MNEEQIKKMIADDFDNLINEKLDSAIIFKYISNIEKENQQLKENNQATQEEMARTWAKLQQKEDIINKISKKCNKEKGRTDFDIFIELNEQLKTLEGFAKKIDYNLHPIITEAYKCEIKNSIDDLCKNLRYNVVYKDVIKEILDNKGE